jgi:hypothetical protein
MATQIIHLGLLRQNASSPTTNLSDGAVVFLPAKSLYPLSGYRLLFIFPVAELFFQCLSYGY